MKYIPVRRDKGATGWKSHRPFAGLGESTQIVAQASQGRRPAGVLQFSGGHLPRSALRWPAQSLPFRVRLDLRPRRSAGSGLTLTRPRRSSGLSAAVKVVRSMASSEATPPHAWRLRTIQRHEQRELTVSQADRAQCLIEMAASDACRPLHMKAEATVANPQRGFERNDIYP